MTPNDRAAERMQRERHSLWDGSVQDKRHQLKQEELFKPKESDVKVQDEHIRRWESASGKWLLDIDLITGQLHIPEKIVDWEDACDLRDAIVQAVHQYAEKKELEASNA